MKTTRIVSLTLALATSLGLAACAAPAPSDDQAAADGPVAEASEELLVSTITDSATACIPITTCRLGSFCLGGETKDPFFVGCFSNEVACSRLQCSTSTSVRVGFIRNESGNGCLNKDSPETLRTCNGGLPIRLWRFEDNLIKSQDGQCLSGDPSSGQVSIKLCANASRWNFDTDNKTFRLLGLNKCLFGKGTGGIGDGVDVRDCGVQGGRYQWALVRP